MTSLPFCGNSPLFKFVITYAWNSPDDLNTRSDIANPEWNNSRQGSHFDFVRIFGYRSKLIRDPSDIIASTMKINVFAGERQPLRKRWFKRNEFLGPKINGLSTDQKVWKAGGVKNVKNCVELMQGKRHYRVRVRFPFGESFIARKTVGRLVIRHFAPSLTSEARRWSSAADFRPVRAARRAAMRWRASRRLMFVTVSVLTLADYPGIEWG